MTQTVQRSLIALLVCGTYVGVMGLVMVTGAFHQQGPVQSRPSGFRRATITDRHGKPLAESLPTFSLAADPARVGNTAAFSRTICAALLEGDDCGIRARLESSKDRRFVYLRRHLTPAQEARVTSLNTRGLILEPTWRRAYALDGKAGQVLGHAGIDGYGLSRLESSYDYQLRRDSATPLRVSLDRDLQRAVDELLDTTMQSAAARGAAAVVFDAATGEVLAHVSLPRFDPGGDTEPTIDLAAARLFEPAELSRFVIRAATAESGRAMSNGTPELDVESLQRGYRQFGFGLRLASDLRHESTGTLPATARIDDAMQAAMLSGYGVSTTLLQMTTALNVVANHGVLVSPIYVLAPTQRRGTTRAPGVAVLAPSAAADIKQWLHTTLESRTLPPDTAGLGGTTRALRDGYYTSSIDVATFIGFATVRDQPVSIGLLLESPASGALTPTTLPSAFAKVVEFIQTLPADVVDSKGSMR